MPITEHASSPAPAEAATTGTTITSPSFSPPADSLVVVMAAGGWRSGGGLTTSISSSDGGSWTKVVESAPSGTPRDVGSSTVWLRYCPTAPGSMTVTVTWNTNPRHRHLVIKVLTGASATQNGATGTAFNGSESAVDLSANITTTTPGSRVYGMVDDAYADVCVLKSGTALVDAFENSQATSYAIKSDADTVTPGTINLGVTSPVATSFTVALVEILPGVSGQEVTGTGIAPTTAFGTPSLSRTVATPGIAPTATFGTAKASRFIRPSGIASTTTFGAANTSPKVTGTLTVIAPAVFGTPVNVVATPLGSYAMAITWDHVWGASGYDVERDGVVIAQDVPGTRFVDTGLSASTTYTYRVRAVRAD